jgi:drug/metabolite transporter (DMT)-like permease
VPVTVDRRSLLAAVGLPLVAAFLWATYYIFVLAVTPGAAPSAVFTYPFLAGGLAYAGLAYARGHGPVFARLWVSPAAWMRTGLLVAMQLSVLASTYLAGPVDTSLLSLIGDVVLTPIVVAAFVAGYRDRFASPLLWSGMLLCLLGGGLAIVGSGRLAAVHAGGYVVAVAIPLTVAGYFLSVARENERTPASAVVAHSMVTAAVVGFVIAPLLPGGVGGLVALSPAAGLVLAATGVTSFFVAPALYFLAIERAGFVVPPMLMTGIPVFAALLGWGLLGIAIPLIGIVGIPIAVVGSIVALRAETAAPPGPGLAAG